MGKRRNWRVIGALVGVLALGAAAACTGQGATWQPGANGSGTDGGTSSPPVDPSLVITPAADAKNVSPADAVTVQYVGGTLDTVTLANPDGKQVKGEFGADKGSWTTTEELGYNKKYTLSISASSPDGKNVTDTRSFTTVKPNNLTLPYLRANVSTLLDGGTFGVGQPIVVWFDEPIKDKAAAERTLTVTTDPPGIVGGWYWMDNREVHWRPKDYWPAHTKVRVDAKVYGRDMGGGLFGQEDRSASFTIGQKKVAIADSKTHRMKVWIDDVQVTKINGKDVTTGIPISMGKGGSEIGANGQVVSFTTQSGPHFIMSRTETYRMTSASFGITDKDSPNYYDEVIKKTLRISSDGEFVHLADWNIWAHGKTNTSHGCINVGPSYIYWFYDNFNLGDVVEVTNTGVKLKLEHGGDWVVPWDTWVKGSALS